MTYLYFLLSLRSLYAVMHSGATVALGSGGGVSAMRSFLVLFGPARVSRRHSSEILIAAACVPSGSRTPRRGATSRAAVCRRWSPRWRGKGGGGLTRIETADHVLSATETIGDGGAARTRDRRRQRTMMTDVRETNHPGVCVVLLVRVRCGAGLVSRGGPFVSLTKKDVCGVLVRNKKEAMGARADAGGRSGRR